ncbi:MAG: hypothetical protein AAFO07_09195 [Bacteroidota bacterium]
MLKHPTLIRIFNWEYWPFYLTQLPVLFIWFLLGIRTGKFGFLTIVNPAIETGGLFGESKMDILKMIPTPYLPLSFFVKKNDHDFQKWKTTLINEKIELPFIVKPNRGERGLLVEKINTWEEFQEYLQESNFDFIIQEYIHDPLELSVLCYRIPKTNEARITSICEKEMLYVIGDGTSTLEELVGSKPRAILQKERMAKKHADSWNKVVQNGVTFILEPIGNHARGTKFLNTNLEIDQTLTKLFISVLDQMEDVHYGRFDIRAKSWESLRQEGTFKVMEFNGVGSEPAHIYDPTYPIWKAYVDLYKHWKIMYRIYQTTKKEGHRPMSFKELLTSYKAYQVYLKKVKGE